MALISTSLGHLGSRFSIIFDPNRHEIQYGSLGLMCQNKAGLLIGVQNAQTGLECLPFCPQGEGFFIVDQQMTMTGLQYEAYSLRHGLKMNVDITAPFYPQDEKGSIVPAYIVEITLEHLRQVRWSRPAKDVDRRGVLRFGISLPGAKVTAQDGCVQLQYALNTGEKFGPDAPATEFGSPKRSVPSTGQATDRIVPLQGDWRVNGECLEVAYDLSAPAARQTVRLALVSHCPDALFECHGQALPLKYTAHWPDVSAVADYVRKNYKGLLKKSRFFDSQWTLSSLSAAAASLTAIAFQSYLMCSLWCKSTGKGWFVVWEGSCQFHSTVDVTYNEAMFYFTCWPELLEMIIEEWTHCTDDAAGYQRRVHAAAAPDSAAPAARVESDLDFPGRIMQHDIGAGWTGNGQRYSHGMPVEENANFLLLLYWHGQWNGRGELYRRHVSTIRALVEYLLWSDSKGNGFPDRGTSNTIDDASPAVQYGRDNVYLGVKRLGALHAAAGMLEQAGDAALAKSCRAAVAKAVKTLNAGWLGDHWGVCLDKTTKGLLDAWSHEPLPYKLLPGWDAYSLYTTNGLLPLMMIGDLPAGLSAERLRLDAVNACRESMTPYGCGHSSHPVDIQKVWVAMNVWRDCAAAYLGENLLANSDRYWNLQVFANGIGSENAKCFTETTLNNNLVWYCRGAATMGLPLAMAGLVMNKPEGVLTARPVAVGRWPLLSLANWKKGAVPTLVVESKGFGRTRCRVEGQAKMQVVK